MGYILISLITAAPYFLVILFFEDPIRDAIPEWTWVLILIVLAFLIHPFWKMVQSLIWRMLNMSQYDVMKAFEEFSQENYRISDINTLGNSLVQLIARALQASSVYLFLPSTSEEFNLVKSEKCDIVILDLNLPDIDGMEVLQEIRRFSSVPVIILTVRENMEDKLRGSTLGTDDYIVKPFKPRELIARVNNAIARKSGLPETR